jgi:alkanesulfonate monooxygenase SsuD/methylene tetrahydromethanopterin reductase-like flavin-dependent oxidoreductase (luciferase family)
MRTGFVFSGGSPQQALALAILAESAGWDAFFVWEALYGADAWVILGAIAARTQRIRLGTMLTPPSRMRPWKLASEVATLDQLSGGRAILSVGLGALEVGFATFGEETDRKTRAELMDESLAIMTRLWSGQPFTFEGRHYRISDYQPQSDWAIRPVQQPHPPVWVVGAWPHERSMRRVVQWDGLLPNVVHDGRADNPVTPADVQAMHAWIEAHRAPDHPVEIIVEGNTPGDDPEAAAAQLRHWADAGADWWIEARWDLPGGAWSHEGQAILRERVLQGPPRLNR